MSASASDIPPLPGFSGGKRSVKWPLASFRKMGVPPATVVTIKYSKPQPFTATRPAPVQERVVGACGGADVASWALLGQVLDDLVNATWFDREPQQKLQVEADQRGLKNGADAQAATSSQRLNAPCRS